MTILSDISLKTSAHWGILFLLALAAIGISYYVYRRTVPPISDSLRGILIALRALSIILVLLLFFEPILSITRQKEEKPVVAVLIDNSASMGLVDQKTNRNEVLQTVLSSSLFKSGNEDYKMQYHLFSHTLENATERAPDSLHIDADGTDIRGALEALNESMTERYFAAVIMLTDGAANLGENPARYAQRYPVPIYPIAVGDPSEQKDILVSNYITNEVAYAGKKVPVEVYIKSSGFGGTRIPVNLRHNGKTVDTQTIILPDNGLEQKVRLHFTPQEEGVIKYEVQLPRLENELTEANNSKSFYTRVLKSKLKILIIAGRPSADFSFLKRNLAADQNLETHDYVEKRGGQFYHNEQLPPAPVLETFDCFILLDYPQTGSQSEWMEVLKRMLANGKPAIFFVQKNTDLNALWALKDFLPLESKPTRGPEQSIYLEVPVTATHHPIMQIYEDDLQNRESWSELPPIFTNLVSTKIRAGAKMLATVDRSKTRVRQNSSMPLMVAQDSGKRKSLLVTGYGIWRWDLLMKGVGKTNQNYQNFLNNSIRWLTTRDDSKLVRIKSNKEIYRSGEEVKFTAQVYTEDYQQVDGAEVAIELNSDKGTTEELTLTNIGDGRYEGSFQVLAGGDYRFSGTAHQQGRVLGRDTGRFSAEEFSLEFQNTRMDEQLLKGIAQASGGSFYTADDLAGLPEKLTFPPKFITLENEWEIWNKVPVLIACLCLLALEWFIRKRKGML